MKGWFFGHDFPGRFVNLGLFAHADLAYMQ